MLVDNKNNCANQETNHSFAKLLLIFFLVCYDLITTKYEIKNESRFFYSPKRFPSLFSEPTHATYRLAIPLYLSKGLV